GHGGVKRPLLLHRADGVIFLRVVHCGLCAARSLSVRPLEPRALWPQLYRLLSVPVRNKGSALNIDREQVKVGPLPRGPLDSLRVAQAHVRVVNVLGTPAQAEFALIPHVAANGVVDHHARVAQQVQRLARVPHHAQVERPVQDARLDTAEAGGAVAADGAEQRPPALRELLLRHLRHLTPTCPERLPGHLCSLLVSRPLEHPPVRNCPHSVFPPARRRKALSGASYLPSPGDETPSTGLLRQT